MKLIKYSTVIIFIIFLFKCTPNKENEVVGLYGIDKFNLLDGNNKRDYEFLKLNSDYTFNVLNNELDSIILKGKWRIVKKVKDRLSVEFSFNNQSIEGSLDGNIFYFIYPNDFHNGKYESVLYVKMRE